MYEIRNVTDARKGVSLIEWG